jgi:hypothetical protein
MRMKLFLLAAAGMLLTVAACKKKTTTDDGNISIAGKTKQEVFMMQKWKLGSWVDSNSTGKSDGLDNCTKVHSYEFKSTTSYILDRHTCPNGDPQTETFSWSMASPNASEVTLWGTYTIVKQTATAITLQREITMLGYPTLETVTLGKY